MAEAFRGVERARVEIRSFALATELGGTVTGKHGVGLLERD